MDASDIARGPTEQTIRERRAKALLSLQIERQIIYKDGPLNYILASSFNDAVDALDKLIDIEPTQVDEIRKLQNDCKRYIELVLWLGNAAVEGQEAFRLLDQTDITEGWKSAFAQNDGDE